MGKYYKGKTHEAQVVSVATTRPIFRYQCPACTNTAVESTNKMLGVTIPCKVCGKMILLDDENRYMEI